MALQTKSIVPLLLQNGSFYIPSNDNAYNNHHHHRPHQNNINDDNHEVFCTSTSRPKVTYSNAKSTHIKTEPKSNEHNTTTANMSCKFHKDSHHKKPGNILPFGLKSHSCIKTNTLVGTCLPHAFQPSSQLGPTMDKLEEEKMNATKQVIEAIRHERPNTVQCSEQFLKD